MSFAASTLIPGRSSDSFTVPPTTALTNAAYECAFESSAETQSSGTAGGQALPHGGDPLTISSRSRFRYRIEKPAAGEGAQRFDLVLLEGKAEMPEPNFPDLGIAPEKLAELKSRTPDPNEALEALLGRNWTLSVESGHPVATAVEGAPLKKPEAESLLFFTASAFSGPLAADVRAPFAPVDPRLAMAPLLPSGLRFVKGERTEVAPGILLAMAGPELAGDPERILRGGLTLTGFEILAGANCAILSLAVEATGKHREPFGGLPSETKKTIAGTLHVETETGWLRRLSLESRTDTGSRGNFQGVEMTMRQQQTDHKRIALDPAR